MTFEPFIEAVAQRTAELVQTGDDLVALPGPLDANTAKKLVASGVLPARKLGRRWYTLRRHLAALITSAPAPAPSPLAGFDATAFARQHAVKRSA